MSLVVVGVVLLPFLIASFVSFTSLVKLEYADHRREWESDGRPSGFFWWPPFAGVREAVRSGLAINVLSLKWLFITPSWARADPRARRLLRRLRIGVAVWNCGIVAAFVAAVLGLLPFP